MSENIELEKMKLAIFTQIAPELAEYFAVEPEVGILSHAADFFTDMLTTRIIQFVYGEEVKKKEVKYPADWRQAFKERWFPRWLKQVFPIKYRTKVLSARVVYPFVSLPDLPHQIIISKARL